MFNNLIESSSHRNEVKRRSYFFLFTTITYALLLAVAGVASIYAYDARLNEQSTELTVLTFAPAELIVEAPPGKPISDPPNGSDHVTNFLRPTRPILIDSSDNPNNPPDQIGIIAPTIPPAPVGAEIGAAVMDPPGLPNGGNRAGATRNENNAAATIEVASPPPPPPASPKKTLNTSRVLNSQAIELPKPPYPSIAKVAGVQGIVTIQILIDEAGKVISAKALSGSPLLQPAAVRAAFQARFSPTIIGDQPVKVSGLITYNFVLQK